MGRNHGGGASHVQGRQRCAPDAGTPARPPCAATGLYVRVERIWRAAGYVAGSAFFAQTVLGPLGYLALIVLITALLHVFGTGMPREELGRLFVVLGASTGAHSPTSCI